MVERKGERVIILKHGMAVAEIIPVRNDTRSETHDELREIRILYDPLAPTEDEWVRD
jgi:antitoxin (DNA-binding transcriptional repressor) of toxin-antitoxin stability system